MGRYARKKGKAASCKGIGRRGGKTKTKTRDLDQINKDLLEKEVIAQQLDANNDGKVSHLYCIHCARFFQSTEILAKHLTSKIHKHRIRKLKDWPEDQ